MRMKTFTLLQHALILMRIMKESQYNNIVDTTTDADLMAVAHKVMLMTHFLHFLV